MADLKAALCIIGTEIVRGIITDSHTKLLCSELSALGFSVNQVIIVPDDENLGHALEQLVGSVDLLVTTGGLGPTSDDVTRHAIAAAAGVELVEHNEARALLIKQIGREPSEANLTQVRFPQGFSFIPNSVGTAPGFYGDIAEKNGSDTFVICLPGPPREMNHLFYGQVLDLLRNHYPSIPEAARDEYSLFLIPESRLEECCRESAVGEVTWGTRFQSLRITLTLSGGSGEDRLHTIENLKSRLGGSLCHAGDVMPADPLVAFLEESGMTIAGAESCTGGLASKLLTDVPGISRYFLGEVTAYHNSVKESLLKVPSALLLEHGAVSAETAIAMAEGARAGTGADAAYSITGIAGPDGGSDDKPVGTVFFGFSSSFRPSAAVRLQFTPYTRDSIRRRAAISALLLLNLYMNGEQLLDIVREWQYI